MNGYNEKFINSPELFLTENIVNNLKWLQESGPPRGGAERGGRLAMADLLKEATFDLVSRKTEEGSVVYDLTLSNQVVKNDVPINGFWCPFIQGNVLPGYVDIPRSNPKYLFMFTPAMNGCAFVIMNSPKGQGWLRVYHNQHPEMETVTHLITRNSGEERLSYFSFDEYGTNSHPNAFNFLYYGNSGWRFVSQPQTINLVTREVGFRPGRIASARNVF